MQEDKSLWITVRLLNIFTSSAFSALLMSCLRRRFTAWRQAGNKSSIRCGLVKSSPHWVRSDFSLFFCECKRVSQGRFFCHIPSPCSTTICFQASWLAPFQEQPLGPCFMWSQCARDLHGTGSSLCLFIRESNAIPTASQFLHKGRQTWLYPFWNWGKQGRICST